MQKGIEFISWWAKVVSIADKYKLPLSDEDDYLEYFEDGDDPYSVVMQELSYVDD